MDSLNNVNALKDLLDQYQTQDTTDTGAAGSGGGGLHPGNLFPGDETRKQEDSSAQVVNAKTKVLSGPELAARNQQQHKENDANDASGKRSTDPKDIWDTNEVPEKDAIDDEEDTTRERPDYDILYKQAVTAEDMYLGISEKDPGSHSCELMVIKVKMPGDRMKDIDLDVTEQRIQVISPKYKLRTYLPDPVKHRDGKAKWDSKNSTLVVTVPVHRKEPWEI
eukprot:gb/GECG01000181.1/.p1 GENE.gb/GECG01000181.1/~~gb/GECG01000181.1/.p1  ORF type:complete len:222 (+),score=44.79 gb/GECG01000181.1/:1-666(+)